MSILIKGMEMPKSCFDCPCIDAENGRCQAVNSRDFVYEYRPHWCPLVPDTKVGKWELAPIGFYFCSNCREAAINAERFCDEIWNYCPYCGARMLKDDDPSHPFADDVMMEAGT